MIYKREFNKNHIPNGALICKSINKIKRNHKISSTFQACSWIFFWQIFLGDLIKISLENVRPDKKGAFYLILFTCWTKNKMCNAMIFVGCLYLPMVKTTEKREYFWLFQQSKSMWGYMAWKRNSFRLILFEYRYWWFRDSVVQIKYCEGMRNKTSWWET